MPRCFVERCHNYGGKRLNIILHSFPNNLDKIKLWLYCIEQSGHVIRDMEELAQRIFEGKTNNRFRVCSEHFTEESYQPSGLRKTLRKDAIPTIFRDVPPQKCPWQKVKPLMKSTNMEEMAPGELNRSMLTSQLTHRHSVSNLNPPDLDHHRCGQANMERTIEASGRYQQNAKEGKHGYSSGTKRTDITHAILKLTLEIICLLTGEDYIVVKKTSHRGDGWSRTLSAIAEPPPLSPRHVKNNKKKMLELTSKIMKLLTGEICEYVEDHHRNVRMETHGALASLDDMVNGLSDPTSTRTMEESSCAGKEENHKPTHHRRQNLYGNIKVEAISYDGRNIADAITYTSTEDSQHYPSTPVKEEPLSCDEGSFTDPEIHTSTDHTQPYASPHIKEEPVLYEDGDLTDPNTYTPTDLTQHYPSVVKEEPVTSEAEDLTEPDIYTPTDHIDRYSPDDMEEPSSLYEGNLSDLTQEPHVTAEPMSCDEGRVTNRDMYTIEQPSSAHREGESEDLQNNYSLFDKGTLDTDIYALIKHAQAKYTFTRIEDGSSSEEEENPKDVTDPQTPADQTRQRPPATMAEAMPQTFQCRDCSECFTRKSGLINHRRNHRQEKLTCPKCGKVFSKRSSLQNHLTLHTGEKPFACPVCGKCFARKSNLISHETIHSGKASFICAECGRYFVCKVHLTKHQIIHEK